MLNQSELTKIFPQAYVRYIQVTLFTVVYIILGYVLKLKAQPYLLLGIPLTILFQLLIVKQPIHRLWVRNDEKIHLNNEALIIAFLFSIFPLYKISIALLKGQLTLLYFGYNTTAIIGAICAGYSFSRITFKTLKYLFICLGISVLIRSITYAAALLFTGKTFHINYTQAVESLLVYIPIAFVVEEVVFRGMIDSYIYSPQKSLGFASALFTSALWGLWHLPLYHVNNVPLWLLVATLVIRHSIYGISFALFWRKSGKLAVPCFSHAFVDAIRDGIII